MGTVSLQSPAGQKPAAAAVPLRVTRCSCCLVYFTLGREIVVTRIGGGLSGFPHATNTGSQFGLLRKLFFPSSFQAAASNPLFGPCWSTAKPKMCLFPRWVPATVARSQGCGSFLLNARKYI